jgi:hypothetical protein
MKIIFTIACLLILSGHALADDSTNPPGCANPYCVDERPRSQRTAKPVQVQAPKKLAAKSGDREVRIFRIVKNDSTVTGDTIPASAILTILFTEEPCSLDIEGAATMRRAWRQGGAYNLGCWYPTRARTWVFIGQVGFMDNAVDMYWEAYPRALLHADGSATITEPNYDAGFQNRVIVEVMRERVAQRDNHQNDRP